MKKIITNLQSLNLKRIFIVYLLFIGLINLSGQYYYNYLRVLEPRVSWMSYEGNIDSATIIVEPKGLYAAVDMYLTFSAPKNNFSSKDTLEIQLTFSLPSGSIVNDSWLLIEDKWEKALILDRWTASSIYESIVKRRRDPSILTKESSNGYKLSIFPMPAMKSRTAKLSFLVPFTFSTNKAYTELPVNIINLSSNVVSTVNVYINEKLGINNPIFCNEPNIVFTNSISTKYPSTKHALITNKITDGTLSFDSPIKNGVFATKYDKGGQGIYQLAFLPSQLLDNCKSKKVVILVNYKGKSGITQDQITKGIKNMVYNIMAPTDSFNIFFSGMRTKGLSDKWLSADQGNLNYIFDNFPKKLYSTYGDLVALFVKGLDFINQEKNVSVLLISESSDFNDLNTSNTFIEDLKINYQKLPPISILDYNINCNYWYTNTGNYFCGNSYMYGVLSRSTGGSNYKLQSNDSFNNKLLLLGQSLDSYISTFDQITSLDSGFCYGRKQINSIGQSVYANKTIMTIGKYFGRFPINIQVSGIINDSVFSKEIIVEDDDILATDSISETIWAGNYIEEMENSGNLQNEEISQIINYSISNRVLSLYTAFLTLEPNVVIEPCDDCTPNDKNIIAVETALINTTENLVEVSPNPFTTKVSIKIKLTEPIKNLNVQIFNTMGQIIKTFSLSNPGTEYEFIWDGKDSLGKNAPKGTYFVKITNNKYIKNIKIVKL
jgi:hypothetical protein